MVDGVSGYQVHRVHDGGEAEGDRQGQVDEPDVDRQDGFCDDREKEDV